jgi:nucleotide-binding universal stress UspA family protein
MVVYGNLPPVPAEPPEILSKAPELLDHLEPPHPEVSVERHLVAGEPAAEILRLARTQKCDLIVMGTHGLAGLDRLLLGSVAEQVLRRAPCPVLTVKAPVVPDKPGREKAERGVAMTTG